MFGIGFSEIAIIVLLVIIVIRPDDMPAFFRKLGRLYAQAKKIFKEVTAVKDDFMRQMDIAAALQDEEKPKEVHKPETETTGAKPEDTPAQDALPQEEVDKRAEESQKE
ncbi:MAG TPA: hypothetical protein VN445_04305 [Rectinemataceae bacterium]|nr:hypothetical protein [Rectinemataceae bacterium]